MTNGSIPHGNITNVNTYAPNIGAPKYIKQILTNINGEINSNTIIVGYFNATYINEQIIQTENQYGNTGYKQHIRPGEDIYVEFHPKAVEYTFFSSALGTFSRIDHV